MLKYNLHDCTMYHYDTKRYAMKRKVADGASGNFRGVCPILNRATVIPNTVCAYASCERRIIRFWRRCVRCADVPMSLPNTERVRIF